MTTNNVNQSGILKGKNGAVNLHAVKLYKNVDGVLSFLNSVNEVGLSEISKIVLYKEVADTVKINSVEDVIPLLIKFAKQGLPKRVTDSLFERVVSWFGEKHADLTRNVCRAAVATSIFDNFSSCKVHLAGTPSDKWVVFTTDEKGNKNQMIDYEEHMRNRYLLVKTYSALNGLGMRNRK
mgnify:CR=1 FL=1